MDQVTQIREILHKRNSVVVQRVNLEVRDTSYNNTAAFDTKHLRNLRLTLRNMLKDADGNGVDIHTLRIRSALNPGRSLMVYDHEEGRWKDVNIACPYDEQEREMLINTLYPWFDGWADETLSVTVRVTTTPVSGVVSLRLVGIPI